MTLLFQDIINVVDGLDQKKENILQRTWHKDQTSHELVEATERMDEMDHLSQQMEHEQGKKWSKKPSK